MAIPKKGLKDIRTLAGRVNQAYSSPYKAYMQLCCLEMEKFRRGKEKESAMHRVKMIDDRFEEIEAEKAAISNALNGLNSGTTSKARAIQSRPANRRSMGGFKIKY